MKHFYNLCILFFALSFLSGCVSTTRNIRNGIKRKQQDSCSVNKKHTEIVYTKDEEREIDKWKKGPEQQLIATDLAVGVSNGDLSAIFWLGLAFRVGLFGWPIDLEAAYDQFDLAASFGFAPAIEMLVHRYQHEQKLDSICLAAVYLHMLVSLGHDEVKDLYLEKQDLLIRSGVGVNIIQEIERISLYKQKVIYENKKLLNKPKHYNYIKKKRYMKSLMEYDIVFDTSYWVEAYEGRAPQNIEDYVLRCWIEKIDFVTKKAQKKSERYKFLSNN